MKISVFGLGYVGCVSVGCLAKKGFNVIGVDISEEKVRLVNSGQSTIVENGLEELILCGRKNGLINATQDTQKAVIESQIALLCVGTPNLNEGHLDMQYILRLSYEIAEALKHKREFMTIIIRSTVMPGTNLKVIETLEAFSGKKHNIDFAVVSNPEFLREGDAISDFFSPPYTVIGSLSQKGVEVTKELYNFLNCPVIEVDVKIAELIKFLNNSFHALKVAFANEVGRLCKELNVDSHELMSLFVKDTELNISPKYFRPGFSYGGSCLPKDLKALQAIAHDKYLELPILQSIERSNRINTMAVYDRLLQAGKSNVGVYGLSFKEGTDDLRFSPSLELVEKLIGKGIKVMVYDSNVNSSKLVGKNKDFLFKHLPHVNEILFNNLNEVLERREVILITQAVKFEDIDVIKLACENSNISLLDLARTTELETLETYSGISW